VNLTDDLRKQIQAHLESGETLVINGSLTLEEEGLEVLPFMRIRGDLTLRGLARLTRLWGLDVAGHLVIDECDLLEELPRLCSVGKGLVLKFNTLLSGLGEKPSCKYLYMESCTSMTILEFGIERCRDITVKHCHNLEIVTQRKLAWVPSEVTIEDCGLVSIPNGFKVGTNLRVTNSERLETIASGVFCGGDLELSGCKRLGHIGGKLFVGGNLLLKDTGLQELPTDMTVEGFLEVHGSDAIRNLAEIKEAGIEVRRKGSRAPWVGSASWERKFADEIMKMENRNKREQAVLSLGTQEFLRNAAERFSRHKLDPDGALKSGRNGQGTSDLFMLSLGGKNWERDPRNFAIIKSVPGWYEIRYAKKFGLEWGRN